MPSTGGFGRSGWEKGWEPPDSYHRLPWPGSGRLARRVAHLLDKFAVREVRAVATSAVREAGNGDECLKVLAELGIDVQVISGREEGLLSFRGALRAWMAAAWQR